MSRIKKTLSSREGTGNVNLDHLQDMLFMVMDVQNRVDQFDAVPATMEGVLAALDSQLADLAVGYADLCEVNDRMASQILSLSVNEHLMRSDILRMTDALSAVVNPADPQALDDAYRELVNGGGGNVTFDTNRHDVMVSFPEHSLKLGLLTAIERHNHDVVSKKI